VEYFGLSSSAQPIKEEDSEAKIDFLIKQVEVLRQMLNPSDFISRNPNYNSNWERGSDFVASETFEKLVIQCLKEMITVQKYFLPRRSNEPDIVATINGKNIPIEIKSYRIKGAITNLPGVLVVQMRDYMERLGSDESIIIVSSKITQEALERFKKIAGKDKIHIVFGNTKEELSSQLVIFLPNGYRK